MNQDTYFNSFHMENNMKITFFMIAKVFHLIDAHSHKYD